MPRRRGPESRSAEEAMRTMAAPTRSRAGCKNVGETLGESTVRRGWGEFGGERGVGSRRPRTEPPRPGPPARGRRAPPPPAAERSAASPPWGPTWAAWPAAPAGPAPAAVTRSPVRRGGVMRRWGGARQEGGGQRTSKAWTRIEVSGSASAAESTSPTRWRWGSIRWETHSQRRLRRNKPLARAGAGSDGCANGAQGWAEGSEVVARR